MVKRNWKYGYCDNGGWIVGWWLILIVHWTPSNVTRNGWLNPPMIIPWLVVGSSPSRNNATTIHTNDCWFYQWSLVNFVAKEVYFSTFWILGIFSTEENIWWLSNVPMIIVYSSYLTVGLCFTQMAITRCSRIGLMRNWMHWKKYSSTFYLVVLDL